MVPNQTKAEAHVEDLIQKGKIPKVTKSHEWCSHAFVQKPGGQIDLVTDLSPLNRHITNTPRAGDTIPIISGPLRNSKHYQRMHTYTTGSSKLITFLLPSGRYRHLITPKGLKTPQKVWTKVKDILTTGFRWATHNADEILIHAPDNQTLNTHLRSIVTRCKHINLKVSDKDMRKGESIRYGGKTITRNGTETKKEDNQAIREFPQPTTRTELRRFIHLVEHLASDAPSFQHNI